MGGLWQRRQSVLEGLGIHTHYFEINLKCFFEGHLAEPIWEMLRFICKLLFDEGTDNFYASQAAEIPTSCRPSAFM